MEVEGQEPERDQRRRETRREQLRRQQVQRRRLVAVGALGALVLAAVLVIPHIGGSSAPEAAEPEAAAKLTALERSRANADRQGQAIEDVLGYTRYIHEGQPRKREVALTFDDGPGPHTDEILRILHRTDTPATFFVLGNMVDERPKLVDQELHQGHAVGGHTFDHPHMGMLPLGSQIAEFNQLDQAMENHGLPRPRLFRPPYASFNADTIELLDHRRLLMVLWSIDTGDYLDPGSDVIVERALDGVGPGSVILMHDGGGDRTETVDALPKVIEGLNRKNLKPVTIPQLLISDPPPRDQSLEQLSGIATETEAPPQPIVP
jgi:peptidoglycan-N-acetylglucosamine deacetylase